MQVLKPELPSAASILPYLEKIDRTNVYSNYGPLHNELQVSLRSWIAARSKNSNFDVSLTSNGTTAIELALRVEALKTKKICVMPSYTFVATAHAVLNSGLEPLLLDIDEKSLALTPEIVESLDPSILENVACVVVVSVFGAPVELDSWDAFKLRTGIPVVVDLAAGIASISQVSAIPICLSLHATKVLGIGEGGAILSTDIDKVHQWTAMTGFGFASRDRESSFRGGNYRLSEYSCAVGIAAVKELDQKIQKLMALAGLYAPISREGNVRLQAGFGKDWISSTFNVCFESTPSAEHGTNSLDLAGIPWRRWWGLGTHTHPAFSSLNKSDLWHTEKLAHRLVGLPFHTFLEEDDILQVRGAVSRNQI